MCTRKIFLIVFLFYSTALAEPDCTEALTDTDIDGFFELAVLNKEVERVRLFLNSGANPNLINGNEETILMRAVLGGDVEVIKALLESPKIKVNKTSSWRWIKGWTPLMVAAASGNISIVELLSNHPDIKMNARNEWGRTALILAVKSLHIPVVKLLAENLKVDLGSENYEENYVIKAALQLGPGLRRLKVIQIIKNALRMRRKSAVNLSL